MNVFKFKLQSALFDSDGHSEVAEQKEYSHFSKRLQKLQQEVQKESENQKSKAEAVVSNSDIDESFFHSFQKAGETFFKSEQNKDKADKFQERGASNYVQWDKKINDGYKHLIQTLLDNNYFDSLSEKKYTSRSVDRIKELYMDCVNSQYKKYVWGTDDDSFKANKDSLFGGTSAEYPANIIYKRLTGVEIWDKSHEKSVAYDIESSKDKIDYKAAKSNYEQNESAGEASEISDVAFQKEFLGHDLPNYLWDIKDTPVFSRILQYTPILSRRIDKPSDYDKKQIENFVKVVNNLGLREGVEGNVEAKLFAVFDEAKSNWTQQKWKEAVEDCGLILNNIKIEDIMLVGQSYINKGQHNVSYTILSMIKGEGSCKGLVEKFYNEVHFQTERGNDKDENNGKELQEINKDLYDFATKLGIHDYKAATRLSKFTPENFAGRKVVDILSDFNNDGHVTYADEGLAKTGLQFKNLLNGLSDTEQKLALNNVFERAKLRNLTAKLGLDEMEINIEQVEAGNQKVILLLQNIISNPRTDLLELVGVSSKKIDSSVENMSENEKVNKVAGELIKGAFEENATVPEGLQQAISGSLYTEYEKIVGAGGTISFDDWVKGLSLSGGLQVGKDGTLSLGVALGYNREINLGNGWSVVPGLSIGFVPFSLDEDGLSASLKDNFASGGMEAAKKWVNDNGVMQKIGLKGSVTELPAGVTILSGNIGWSRDKLAGVESQEFADKKLKEFKDFFSELFGNIANVLEGKQMNLREENIIDKVRDEIGKLYDSKLSDKEKEKADRDNTINDMIAYLERFNGEVISEDNKEFLVGDVAEEYTGELIEQKKNDFNGESYLSNASIGLSWVIGTEMLIGHAGFGRTKHEKDGYYDKSFSEYENTVPEEFKYKTEIDAEMLSNFNKILDIPGAELKLENGFVVIPQQCLDKCTVKINPKMKGLIKKNEAGDVLLSPKTFVSWPSKTYGVAGSSTEFVIGGNSADAVELNLNNYTEYVTDGEIDENRLSHREKVDYKSALESALKNLREQCPNDEELKNYQFPDDLVNQLDNSKNYKIILKKGIDNKIVYENLEELDGDMLQIEYKVNQEAKLMADEVQNLANDLYSQLDNIKSNALFNVSHTYKYPFTGPDKGKYTHHAWKEYVDFAGQMKNSDYENAKNTILELLPKMQKYINQNESKVSQVDFSSIITGVKDLEGVELGQALMSINNMFARVASVHGEGTKHDETGEYGEYNFNGKTVDRVIESRAREIDGKLQRSNLGQDIKDAYHSLIEEAEQKRQGNPEIYQNTKMKAKMLENAVGINLGNGINPENLLFNPEVYSDLIDVTVDNQVLHNHALELFANNKALITPVLSALGFSEEDIVNLKVTKAESGEITLDINGKNVILSADMKFGYFAQCVNHMLLLDNIHANIVGEEGSVNFGPSVLGNGVVKEGTKGSIMSTTETRVGIAVRLSKQVEQPQGDGDTDAGGDKRTQQDPSSNPGESGSTGSGDSGQTGGEGSSSISEGTIGGGGSGGESGGESDPKVGDKNSGENEGQSGDADW